MGIPRFYRWLKNRYPLIRFDISDNNKEIPIFDNFYIDFNALVYQCIRENGCFLKNKVKPLTFDEICQRVIVYLLEVVKIVNPRKLLFIAFDGVAPRAKINQSRDRRFRAAIEDIEFFDNLIKKMGINDQQIFMANSISPGTEFLFNLCKVLKVKIMELMNTQWKGLSVFYSDCCVPGEGEHKIMEFIRYSKKIELFNKNTTHCVYSPDADVILLTLALNLEYICIIKEDTTNRPSSSWTAVSSDRKAGTPQFELVMINIVREYLEQQFEEQLKRIQNCKIQSIINDFVVLMAFVGNDFLPVQFCFVLKDEQMDALFNCYKDYLKQRQAFINNDGNIDWKNVSYLLKQAKRFEANRISEMKNQRKYNTATREQESVFDEVQKKGDSDEKDNSEIQKFQVQDNKIVNGIQHYYQTRFNIQDRKQSHKFKDIIEKYIEGLEFYCQYYYKGLPSWTWHYPYHYTPLLCDMYDYIIANNHVKVQLKKDEPFDPILALMFMFPEQNFRLLPEVVSKTLMDPTCILRSPVDYFPKKFSYDKYETLKYNKRALIEFLKEEDVVKVYRNIPKNNYKKEQLERNQRKNTLFYYQANDKASDNFTGLEVVFDQSYNERLKGIIRPQYDGKQKDSNQRRFPTLKIYGEKFKLNEKGRIISQQKYKYLGNTTQIVFFNNFVGYVDQMEKTTPDVKEDIDKEYSKAGIVGSTEKYYIVKRGQALRQLGRFHVAKTKKQVIIPDYALFKAPNYDYIHKTSQFQIKQQYQVRERVIVLSPQYFGCCGTIVEIGDKTVKVKLTNDPIKSQKKIQALDQEFYTIEYVLNHLQITKQTLFAIIGEVILLPIMKNKRNDFNERLPTALNFGLHFIDVYNFKIAPRYVRCNFAFENTKNPLAMFDSLQFSAKAVKLLEQYSKTFHQIIEVLEEDKSTRSKRQYKVSRLYGSEKEPNIKAYQQFVKLYQFQKEGRFCSIYSKVANTEDIPNFYTQKKSGNAIVTLNYHEIISRKLAMLAPPPYKSEPEYHDIGSRVILLKSLQVGYVVGIDDYWIDVLVGKQKRRSRVKFIDLYNQSWDCFRMKDIGTCWNLQVSYYIPTYWKKAISSDK